MWNAEKLRILIAAFSAHGHGLAFVRRLIPAVRDLGFGVDVAIPQGALSSREFETQLSRYAGELNIHPIMASGAKRKYFRAVVRLVSLRRAVINLRPDYVFVVDADGVAQLAGMMGAFGWRALPRAVDGECLILGGRFAYEQGDAAAWLSKNYMRLAVACGPWSRVHHLDPIVFRYINEHMPKLSNKLSLMPDPVDAMQPRDTITARRALGIPIGGRYVGCVGTLTKRKGIDLLLSAFCDADLREDDRLLLVGRADQEVRCLLEGEYRERIREGRIVVIDDFVDDRVLELALQSVNVVCAPYPRHIGSASVVILAAAAQRPVLGSEFGWIGEMVRQYNLGDVCDVRNHQIFAKAITSSIENSSTFMPDVSSQRFVTYNSVENYRARWVDLVRSRGRGRSPRRAAVSYQGSAGVVDKELKLSSSDVAPIAGGELP